MCKKYGLTVTWKLPLNSLWFYKNEVIVEINMKSERYFPYIRSSKPTGHFLRELLVSESSLLQNDFEKEKWHLSLISVIYRAIYFSQDSGEDLDMVYKFHRFLSIVTRNNNH